MTNKNFWAELNQWLDDNGYRLISHSCNDFSEHIIKFKMKDEPPALGIHVTDGLAGKDKVGG